MRDENKTKKELIQEINALRNEVNEIKKLDEQSIRKESIHNEA
ncbi:hypothetical protein [Methanohalobium evestigatum]|nr:hypothetical protein [Methanohalobium evestigatum]